MTCSAVTSGVIGLTGVSMSDAACCYLDCPCAVLSLVNCDAEWSAVSVLEPCFVWAVTVDVVWTDESVCMSW